MFYSFLPIAPPPNFFEKTSYLGILEDPLRVMDPSLQLFESASARDGAGHPLYKGLWPVARPKPQVASKRRQERRMLKTEFTL